MNKDALEQLNKLGVGGLLNKPALNQVSEIELNKLHEDPKNARKKFNQEELDSLAESINVTGILQPISVRKHDEIEGHYIINCGHRRYRASLLAGKTTIPAFLNEKIDSFGRFLENIQREDLSPLDIANQLKEYLAEGYTNQDIAAKIGKSDSWVSRHLSILDAPAPVKTAIEDGRVKSFEAAAALTNLHEDYAAQVEEFLDDSVEDVSQKKVRELSKNLKGNKPKKSKSKKDDNSVTGESLDDNSATGESLDDNSVTGESLDDNSVTGESLDDNSAGEDEESKPKAKKPSSPLIDLIKEIKLSDMQIQYLVAELQDTSKYDASFDKLREFFSEN